MKLIISILFTFSVGAAHADLSSLIEAIKADNTALTLEWLAKKDGFGCRVVDVNDVDNNGRRPLFYASSPEMIRLLFANDARLVAAGDRTRLHTDINGMNPLHFLFVSTTVRLLEEAGRDDYAIRRRIESAAFTFLIAYRQEATAGWYSGSEMLEDEEDLHGNVPADYLEGPHWRAEFTTRMRNEHQRRYNEPVGGFAAAEERKRVLALKLWKEHAQRLHVEEQNRRRANTGLMIAAPRPIRAFAERPAMLIPEFFMLLSEEIDKL